MEQLELNVEKRTVIGKQVKQLRDRGIIPAVLFGHEIGSLAIQVPEKSLRVVLNRAGMNRLITLKVEVQPKPMLALVRGVQRDAIKGTVTHVDFQAVVMTEKIRTTVPVHFFNESPAVLNGIGVLLHDLDEIEIECLPGDLISHIDVDLSGLNNLDDAVYVKDLRVPPVVTILNDLEEMVVHVARVAEAEEELEAAPQAAGEVEVVRKGKVDEEE